jgi:hypothetical protein
MGATWRQVVATILNKEAGLNHTAASFKWMVRRARQTGRLLAA